MISKKANAPLNGTVKVPGDKSISHRSLMFGALTIGETMISGLLEGEDVLATAEAMRAMGATIEKSSDGLWRTYGVGIGGLQTPDAPIDMGNSGTSTRLLMGLVGGHDITATFTGDASLSKRPMKRVMTPLAQMGAKFEATNGDKLPLTVYGAKDPLTIEYRLPVASAQVKSAVILGGLNARGTTTVIEETPTRDHTENMLRAFGLEVDIEELEDGAKAIHVKGQQNMQPCAIDVPADPSSAAFPTVAALLTEGSDITISNVCINPTRIGLYITLKEMGAKIEFMNERTQGGEPVADIRVQGTGPLNAITVPAERVPSMIDEFPILAMVCACANGTTKMSGLEELRVKESDRLAMVAEGLKACGVSLEEGKDTLIIHSNGCAPIGGASVKTALDHRIAMSFLVLGSATDEPVNIDDGEPIKTSFPNFVELMNEMGCNIA